MSEEKLLCMLSDCHLNPKHPDVIVDEMWGKTYTLCRPGSHGMSPSDFKKQGHFVNCRKCKTRNQLPFYEYGFFSCVNCDMLQEWLPLLPLPTHCSPSIRDNFRFVFDEPTTFWFTKHPTLRNLGAIMPPRGKKGKVDPNRDIGKCDDCGRENVNVRRVPYCPEDDCCFRHVCDNGGCWHRCPKCSREQQLQHKGYYNALICKNPTCKFMTAVRHDYARTTLTNYEYERRHGNI